MNPNRIYVGMDPGKLGAISFLYPDEVLDSIRYPLINSEYDLRGFMDIFNNMKTDPNYSYHIIIEDVKALQKPMQAGNWSLSRGKTILECMAACYDIPYTLVHSKTWQKEMWQGVPQQFKKAKSKTSIKNGVKTVTKANPEKDTKAMSRIAAQRLFPNAELRNPERATERGKVPDDGVCDAALMAEFGRRKGY